MSLVYEVLTGLSTLIADVIEANYFSAVTANITSLTAINGYITNLSASGATIYSLSPNEAVVTDSHSNLISYPYTPNAIGSTIA